MLGGDEINTRMEVSRRRVGTYGKSNKRVLVHDLFNVAQNESDSHENIMLPTRRNAPSSGVSTPFSEMSEDPEAAQQLRKELSAFADSSSQLLRGVSPGSISATPFDATSPSLFDVESSSDEMNQPPNKSETTKKRKLAPKSSNVHIDNATAKSLPTSISDRPLISKASKLRSSDKTKPKTRRAQTKKAPSGLRQKANEVADETQADVPSSHSSLDSSQETPPDLGSPLSEKSIGSAASTRSTPKRKRRSEEDTPSDFSSPSQLEMSSLHLTPNRQSRARAMAGGPKEREARTPSKASGRLVDRLDSPSKPPPLDIDLVEASPRPSKSRKLLSPKRPPAQDSKTTDKAGTSLQPYMPRGENGRSDAPAPRIRTYGKKRTHLQDNAPGADSQGQGSSQQSLQDLVSQVESLAASKSQFEIEDISDDEDSGPRFKSIHELRHAGITNRFDRDLDTLLEDIESGYKSLRIQALMSLVRKFQDKSFKAHVLVSGKLGRLTVVTTPTLDLPSSATLVLALWALAVDETATAHALSQIYECLLQLPPAVLTEERAISEIAKDRKENVSKLLVRDLASFEQYVLQKSVKHEGQADHIIVSRVYLRCLELTLRRIVGLAGRAKDPSIPVFEAVVYSIKHNLKEIASHGERPELIESIRLLLSWIEFTAAISINIGHSLPPRLLEEVGTVLSRVMGWSKNAHPSLEQSSIKSAVELSKGNSTVCSQFADTSILPTMFNVVHEYFSQLAANEPADQPQGEKLGTVILALGCLLHFAEYSDEVRMKMMIVDGDGDIQVDKLVNIFNAFVDEAGESTTKERTRALGPPFGWLCLLLCTLCLEVPLRRHISSNIQGDGLNRLLKEAEICFNHMKLIDEDSFVERFGKTLDAVRNNATL